MDIKDLDHSVPPQNVLSGAWRLLVSIPSLPNDSVIVTVVDPHVGIERNAVAVQLKTGPILVGPGNGLLSAAVQLYGAEKIHLIKNPAFFNGHDVLLELRRSSPAPPEPMTSSLPATLVGLVQSASSPSSATLRASYSSRSPGVGNFFEAVTPKIVSATELSYVTFDGLRLFGPVGAHLASGVQIEEVGPSAELKDITPLWLPLGISNGKITGCLVDFEAFGNARTNIPVSLSSSVGFEYGSEYLVKFWSYYLVRQTPDESESYKDEEAGQKFESHSFTAKLVHTFAEASSGSMVILPGSGGGCLDLAVVNGSALNQFATSGNTEPLGLLKLKPYDKYLTPVNEVTIERTSPHSSSVS